MTNHPKIVVLISGQGSNLQAILDACAQGELAAQIVAVISNNPTAKGLARAERFSVPAVIKAKLVTQSRLDYDKELADLIAAYKPDWIVLAGWMHLLSNVFLNRFPHQVINLHPALPGMFPGTQAIQRAFAAFQRHEISHTGVMVHLVPDEGIDSGPVLGETWIAINANDTLDTLATRVHAAEHRLLIDVLKKIISTDTLELICKN